MTGLIVNLIGYAATVIGTSLMLPQIVKTFKTKSAKDLSSFTLFLYFLNCLLWGIYGILIHAFPVVLTNSIALIISIMQIGAKLKYS